MRGMRLAIALVTAATLVALFVVARPNDDDRDTGAAGTSTAATRTGPPTAEPAEPTTTAATTEAEFGLVSVRIVNGEPTKGIVRVTVHEGDPVRVVVRGDATDEVHVHGYDLKGELEPGRPVDLRFDADLTGRFEIELEDAGRQIAQLTVLP